MIHYVQFLGKYVENALQCNIVVTIVHKWIFCCYRAMYNDLLTIKILAAETKDVEILLSINLTHAFCITIYDVALQLLLKRKLSLD